MAKNEENHIIDLRDIFKERNKIYDNIAKLYYKLGCPKEWEWLPNLKDCSYYVGVSDRSRGKTTNILLFCLCAFELYGYTSIYFRSHMDEVKASKMEKLCQVINNYGYVSKATKGRYTKIKYKRNMREFVLINEEEKVESETFMRIFIVDNYLDYSGDNECNANIFFYDEFINEYKPETALHFFYIHKTLARERHTIFNIMVGNTIDKNNKWFDELGLRETLKRIKRGENKLVQTEHGTIIRFELFAEITDNKLSLMRKITNALYYGFSNPRLSVITGDGDIWSMKSYPPIRYYPGDKVINNKIKLSYNHQVYSLTVVYNDDIGLHLNIKPYNDEVKDDMLIMVDYVPQKRNETYGFYQCDRLLNFFTMKKVFYSDNFTGNDIECFINNAI